MLDLLVQPEVQQFIREHQNSDLNRLLLNKNKYPQIPVDLVVDQIRAREKARQKIPLWADTPKVIMPPLLSMEQCSSESTAKYKAGLVSGQTCIDLTGGAGVDSFYLSKRFNKVHYVETNRELAKLASYNFTQLGTSNIEVHTTTSEDFLAGFEGKVDLIYIDPARRDQQNKVFRFESCSPNILELQTPLLQKAKQILVKASPMLDITQGINQLENVSEVFIVAVKNEVKELLFLQKHSKPSEVLIKAIDLERPALFEFKHGEHVSASTGIIRSYLYEPNAAIMKSGGINELSKYYPVQKLHENTHLFTSDTLVSDFPGRSFKVENVVKYAKKDILSALHGNKANVATRNFPDTVDQFRKKTGLKPGGERYIFGFTNYSNQLEVAICMKTQ